MTFGLVGGGARRSTRLCRSRGVRLPLPAVSRWAFPTTVTFKGIPAISTEQSNMIAPMVDGKASRAELDTAAWVLERLSVEAGRAADRSRLRRSLEAAMAWPTEPGGAWWKWFGEACRSLSFKCKVLDCTFDQLTEIARDGAPVVTRSREDGSWTVIEAAKGRRFHVLRPHHASPQEWLSRAELRRRLQVSGGDGVFRCLVIESGLPAGDLAAAEPGRPTPFNRLWALLRPESSDIWVIVGFALVTGLLALATPLAVETLVNTVAFGRLLQPVIVLALMLLAFLSFSSALRALQTYVVEIVQRRLFARVAADLAYRLPRTRIEATDQASGRELVNRFFDVVTVQKVSAQLLLDGISLVIGALVGMAVLAFYHPWLLGFDVVLLALIAFAILVLGRGAVDSSIKESKTKYRVAAWLEDLIGCPTAFRHSGAAEFALDRADQLTYDYLIARKSHFRVVMRQIVFALGMQALASTVLLGLGGWLVISGQLTLGQLVAAELIVTVIVGAFAKLGKHMESYYDLLAAVDKLGVLFDLPMEHQDGLLSMPHDQPAEVVVRGVSYELPSGGRVENLSLRVESGERLMLTGKSGVGKSRLLDLLYGWRTASLGHVAINGIDPRDLRPDALRRYVALVRDVEIFDGSIAENVHLERPEISVNDVREALHQVGLLEDVLRLPEGLSTPLVQSGFPLTTNQARKLMLARAIAGAPTLLLVDGLVDALPDDELQQLSDVLIDPQQPWTLIQVTGRRDITKFATRVQTLEPAEAPPTQETMHVG